jgi:pimeloyl-ACP methyl ester carboxylesterase
MLDHSGSSELEHVDIQTNAVRLHTVQAGPKNGRLLVFLHGFPEYWYGWRGQIDFFAARGWRVVAPDQRGYNLSDKPRGVWQYQVEQLAADVDGLIRGMGRDKACLVGHDWGAAVAWETAIRYPQRLEKLAILNVPHPDVMTRFLLSDRAQLRKSWYIFFFQIPGLPELLLGSNHFAGLRRMMRVSGNEGSFSEADLNQYASAWSQPGALSAMINWYRAVFRRSLSGPKKTADIPVRRVTVPVLILWGKKDIALSTEMVQPSLDLCGASKRAVFYENASHWVQHDETNAVNRELEDHLG